MTTTFKSAIGRTVVSTASAETIGELTRLVVDVNQRRVTELVVGKGRKALLVSWDTITGFGPDAVMLAHDQAARPPADEDEKGLVDGRRELLGQRALTELGNEIGKIDDVEFDPATGILETLIVGEAKHPASTLLGIGPYAAVLDRTTNPA